MLPSRAHKVGKPGIFSQEPLDTSSLPDHHFKHISVVPQMAEGCDWLRTNHKKAFIAVTIPQKNVTSMELSKMLGKDSPTGIHGQWGVDTAEPWATEQPPGPAMLLLFVRTTLLSSPLATEQPLKGLQHELQPPCPRHKLVLCLSGPGSIQHHIQQDPKSQRAVALHPARPPLPLILTITTAQPERVHTHLFFRGFLRQL